MQKMGAVAPQECAWHVTIWVDADAFLVRAAIALATEDYPVRLYLWRRVWVEPAATSVPQQPLRTS